MRLKFLKSKRSVWGWFWCIAAFGWPKSFYCKWCFFCKSGSFKSHTSFYAVQITKIVFNWFSAAFFQCHGQMLEGFKYIYPSQRFYCSRLMCFPFFGRLLRRSTRLHTKICFSVELLVVQFLWNSLGMPKSRWVSTSALLALLAWISYWFDSRSFGLSAVLSNFHKTINRSSTVS